MLSGESVRERGDCRSPNLCVLRRGAAALSDFRIGKLTYCTKVLGNARSIESTQLGE